MKYIIYLYIFFVTFSLHSQKLNYVEYNRKINEAEIAFLNQNYEEYIRKFRTAFSSYPKCLPENIMVASQIAYSQEDYKSLSFFLEKGFSCGINKYVFDFYFQNFKNDSSYIELMNKYSKIRFEFSQKVDSVYRMQVLDLRERDYNANTTHNFFNVLFFKKKATRKLVNNSKEILSELDFLINEKGIPSIELIGTKDTYPYFGLHTIPWILYTHYPLTFPEHEKVLKNALNNGDISAYNYAILVDFGARWYNEKSSKKDTKLKIDFEDIKYKEPYYYVRWEPRKHLEQLSIEKIKIIDKRRDSIGLMPLEYEVKKKGFQIRFNQHLKKRDNDFENDCLINFYYYKL